MLFADRYAFRGELGRGSVGRVLQVADTREDGAPRAMKVVPPEEAARLRWEFELLASISHPNVAQVYELLRVGEAVGDPFRLGAGDAVLIEQYVAGETAERLADGLGGGVDDLVAFVVSTGRALARALSAIHAAGMVHGDVKPQNVIVPSDGDEAVLIDLGLARPPGQESRVGGTPGYMAPEAWQGERSVATDLYALGATLHRLLAGRPPGEDTQGRSVAEVVARALSRWRAGVRLPSGTPKALTHLLEALVEPEPAARPTSAREVMARLGAIAADLRGETTDPKGLVASAGAEDRPSPAERAMRVRALPFVGHGEALAALLEAIRGGGVVAVVGPHGSGRSRLVTEAIRAAQERRAEAEQSVATALRVESALPSDAIRHDAILHVQAADGVNVDEARGLVRAGELEGRRLSVVLERRTAPAGIERTVEVGRLEASGIAQLLSHALDGAAPSSDLVRAALDASGGLSGRLCRLLASGLAEDRDVARPEVLTELAGSDATGEEPTVPAAAREVAELVAVAGGELDPEDAVRALGSAGRFDLLVADGLATLTERGRLHLRADVASVLRARLDTEQRYALASRLDRARLPAEARPFVLAARGELEEAAEGFLAAVRHRRRLGSVEKAASLAVGALDDLTREPMPTAELAERVMELRLEHADALRALGRYPDAARAVEPVTSAAGHLLRAEIARLAGDAVGARDQAERARAAATGTDVRVRAETVLARLELDAGHLDQALEAAGRVRDEAVGEGLDTAAARALEVGALVHAARGELEETGRLASEAVGRARRAGDRASEARARSIAANVALRTGRVQAAARAHVDAFELAQASGEAHAAASFLVNVGLARLDA
ncbi:MAG: protein kinase domain-containing protein, partial [Myxococcota bacterium]